MPIPFLFLGTHQDYDLHSISSVRKNGVVEEILSRIVEELCNSQKALDFNFT
jgi:hypothetical protein